MLRPIGSIWTIPFHSDSRHNQVFLDSFSIEFEMRE